MFDSLANRRDFCKAAATTLGGFALAGKHADAAAVSGLLPCKPEQWRKRGLVLDPSQAPVGGWLQNFTSPAEPLAGDRWRL